MDVFEAVEQAVYGLSESNGVPPPNDPTDKAQFFSWWRKLIFHWDYESLKVVLPLFKFDAARTDDPFHLYMKLALEHHYCELNMVERSEIISDVGKADPEEVWNTVNEYMELAKELGLKPFPISSADDLYAFVTAVIQEALSRKNAREMEELIVNHPLLNVKYDTAFIHSMRELILSHYEIALKQMNGEKEDAV